MAGANRLNWPRRGSVQFWPRVRAKRLVARIRNWADVDGTKLLAFIGYKVGMAHVMLRDNRATSISKGQNIAVPVTIIECPTIKINALKFYKNSVDGLKLVSTLHSKNPSSPTPPTPPTPSPNDFDDIKLVVSSQPTLAKIKKKSDVLEIAISNCQKEEKLNYAKGLLGKEIKISEIFREGQYIDVHAVTKGKGFQGTVKRFGVKIRRHKSEKTKRGVGTLGSWTPKHISFRVAQPGKMGYHTRTEYNKLLMRIASNPTEINPASGFTNYGIIRNDYIILKGTVPGPQKRPIVLTEPMRPRKPELVEIRSISTTAK